MVDLTAQGRQVARPSPDKPAYYLAVIPSFHEVGVTVAGEQPLVMDIVHILAKELATQGYLASRGR